MNKKEIQEKLKDSEFVLTKLRPHFSLNSDVLLEFNKQWHELKMSERDLFKIKDEIEVDFNNDQEVRFALAMSDKARLNVFQFLLDSLVCIPNVEMEEQEFIQRFNKGEFSDRLGFLSEIAYQMDKVNENIKKYKQGQFAVYDQIKIPYEEFEFISQYGFYDWMNEENLVDTMETMTKKAITNYMYEDEFQQKIQAKYNFNEQESKDFVKKICQNMLYQDFKPTEDPPHLRGKINGVEVTVKDFIQDFDYKKLVKKGLSLKI